MSGGLPTFGEALGKIGVSGHYVSMAEKWDPLSTRASKLFSGIFKPPDPVEFPEPRPATPPPTISETQEAGEAAKRRRPRGRRGTFLTGDITPALSPTTGKKKLLG